MGNLIKGMVASLLVMFQIIYAFLLVIYTGLKLLWNKSRVLFLLLVGGIVVLIIIVIFFDSYQRDKRAEEKRVAVEESIKKEAQQKEEQQKEYAIQAKEEEKTCLANKDKKALHSCAIAGEHYALGRGVAKDVKKGLDYLQRVCSGNYNNAVIVSGSCNRIGEVYRDTYNEYEKAYEYFKKSCDNNNAWGCANIGKLIRDDLIAPKGFYSGTKSFKKACCLSHNRLNVCKGQFKFTKPEDVYSYDCKNIFK